MLPTSKDKKGFITHEWIFSQIKFRLLENEIFEFFHRNFTNHTQTFTIVVSIFQVKQLREVCLAQVQYDLDILGMKGPRNMHILAARPHDNVYEVLNSKKAAWDGQLKSYVLDFHGRASQVCVCVW